MAFGCKKFLPRECNYSAIEHEALAIVKGIQHFRTYLEGTKFKIDMDHNSLTHMSTLKDSHGRLARWSLALHPFYYTVAHRNGHANANSDVLSRDQGSLFKGGGMSGINLTDKQQQISQLSNSASAKNVIEMNGTNVTSMAIGSWTQ